MIPMRGKVAKKKRQAKAAEPGPLRLDLGCGTSKKEGFHGVDSIAFAGVDTVADLRRPWPWADDTVDEVWCSHFVEHLEWPERVHVFEELYRVLKVGSKATIVTPHWSHACFYGDPTHKAPLSEWYCLYLNKAWRSTQAPHAPYTCDFDWTFGGSWDQWLQAKNDEYRQYAMNRLTNSWRDLIVTLVKRPKTERAET